MRTHAQCHVWVEGSLGNAAARVDERAYVHGSFGEVEAAYFVSQDRLESPGTIGTHTAQGRDIGTSITSNVLVTRLTNVSIGGGILTANP